MNLRPASLRLSIGIVVMLVLCSFGFPSTRAVPEPRPANPGSPGIRKDDDPDQDQEIFRFSTVGDSRQDLASPDASTIPLSVQDQIWLQNTKAFSRILESILEQKASILFFNGDMIMGYGKAASPDGPGVTLTVNQVVGSDLVQFYRQYAFWRGMVAGVMERGTYVVPIPGNHETQWKSGGKIALEVNENAWRANMGDLILDGTRFESLLGQPPTSVNVGNNGALDGLGTDQSQLSYSFDFNGSHFAVINTDPTGSDAHAPSVWLKGDLGAAQTRGCRHFFVFGHKPAYTYYFGVGSPAPTSPSGLDKFVASRDAFWDVIETYGATYFCGHEHIFHMSQPRQATGGKAWQVIVGSGGSPFEATTPDTLHPETDRDYAWATVKVYRNGKVKITVYGFDDHYGPTRVLQTETIR